MQLKKIVPLPSYVSQLTADIEKRTSGMLTYQYNGTFERQKSHTP